MQQATDGDGRVDVLSASEFDDKIAWYKNGGGSPPIWTPNTISAAADGARSVFKDTAIRTWLWGSVESVSRAYAAGSITASSPEVDSRCTRRGMAPS